MKEFLKKWVTVLIGMLIGAECLIAIAKMVR